MESLRAVGRTLERFVSELARDDFLKRDVSEGSARTYLHHGPMPQAELAHSLGNDINQELLIGDDLGCFLKELSRHIGQGTDGAECFRRELKNGWRVAHESGRKRQWSEHGTEEANRDFAGSAPDCQSDLLSACHERGNTRSKAWPKEIRPAAAGSVRAVAQLGRAPGSGPGGRGFKSHQPDNLHPPQISLNFRNWLPTGFKFIIRLCNSKRRSRDNSLIKPSPRMPDCIHGPAHSAQREKN